MDLAMYASRSCPDFHSDEIKNYKPQQPGGWSEIIGRVCKYMDDGHAAKLIRALAHGQKISQSYEQNEEFRIKHDGMFTTPGSVRRSLSETSPLICGFWNADWLQMGTLILRLLFVCG